MASPTTRLSVVLFAACALQAVHVSAQSSTSAQTAAPERIESGFGEGAYKAQPGIREPLVLRRVEAIYPPDAMRARIHGEVVLEAVVLTDGTVGAIRVTKSLDRSFGVDQEAIKAGQRWQFVPGTYNGKAVPCVVQITIAFEDPATGDTTGYLGRSPSQPRVSPAVAWIPDVVFLKGVARLGQPDVTMPVLERSVEPKYTADAMRAKIIGTVTVDMVVGPDGSVVRSRIARSLDTTYGLDRAALEAASQWRFKPGLVNGQPTNVLVTATMEFRLH